MLDFLKDIEDHLKVYKQWKIEVRYSVRDVTKMLDVI